MTPFRLLNYADANGKPCSGILVGEQILDLQSALTAYAKNGGERLPVTGDSILELLAVWPDAKNVLAAIAEVFAADPSGALSFKSSPITDAHLFAPLLYPNAIFCIARNYAAHAKEMSGIALPDKETSAPSFFNKLPAPTIIGSGEAFHLPCTSNKIDWEAELAVVIGTPTFRVPAEKAMDSMAGFVILNDLSIRGPSKEEAITPELKQFRADRFWRKNFDGSAPLGPWITPKEFVPDPYDLPIKLWVNDELMQDGNSGDMHFTIEEQIAHLSQQFTLQPGDVISTGTPAGVGKARGVYLKAGDEITTRIGDLGTLRVSVLASR